MARYLTPRSRAQIISDQPDIAEHQNPDKINPRKPFAISAGDDNTQAEYDSHRPVVCRNTFHVLAARAAGLLIGIMFGDWHNGQAW